MNSTDFTTTTAQYNVGQVVYIMNSRSKDMDTARPVVVTEVTDKAVTIETGERFLSPAMVQDPKTAKPKHERGPGVGLMFILTR